MRDLWLSVDNNGNTVITERGSDRLKLATRAEVEGALALLRETFGDKSLRERAKEESERTLRQLKNLPPKTL